MVGSFALMFYEIGQAYAKKRAEKEGEKDV